jgi:dihydrofolate reductase
MANLIFSMMTSLDGYIADASGNFDWAEPDEEVHRFVNDIERPIGTYLFGRRMYEVMTYWETPEALEDENPVFQDFARIWQATDKIVYSTSLDEASTARTRLERSFDPIAVRAFKADADRNISIGGPELAANAFRAGLVDEIQLFINPVVVGGGKQALPDDIRLDLDLVDEHRFGNGVVFLHYRCR